VSLDDETDKILVDLDEEMDSLNIFLTKVFC